MNGHEKVNRSSSIASRCRQWAQTLAILVLWNGLVCCQVRAANLLPWVTITNPVERFYLTPASFTLQGDAWDADGTVMKVQYFLGATSLGVATNSPWSVEVTNLLENTYVITAKATDNSGGSSTSQPITIMVVDPPTALIASPTNGSIFYVPATFAVQAAVTNKAGSIAEIQFFQNSLPIGSVTNPPWTLVVSNLAAGSYEFSVKSIHTNGMTWQSRSVMVSVQEAPTVTITAPAAGAVLPPGSFTLLSDAGYANGTITRVAYYAGTNLLGVANDSPYSWTVNNLTSGVYVLTARATDSDGGMATSGPVTVRMNQAPTVSITGPKNGAVFVAPANFNVQVATADKDGTVVRMDYFLDGVWFGSTTNTPFTAGFTNVPAGMHAITAQATDNDGGVTTSVAVTVRVGSPPTVSITAPIDGAVYLPPGYFSIQADASDGDGTVTKVQFFRGSSYAGVATNSPYTLDVTNVPSGVYALTAKATDNDGGTTTSDPVTVRVDQLPTVAIGSPRNGAILYAPASFSVLATAGDKDGTVVQVDFYRDATWIGMATNLPFGVGVSNLSAGKYAFTATATDNDGGVTTSAPTVVVVDQLPVVSLIAPANGDIIMSPGSFTLQAEASDVDGTVSKVEFYAGTTRLGVSSNSPWALPVTNLVAGTYVLTAKATDDSGGTTISSESVTIRVNSPPTIGITSPRTGSIFFAPASLSLQATTSDRDGTIAQVEFFQDGTSVGVVTGGVYTVGVSNLAAGAYVFTARATDNDGAVATSTPVSISVDQLAGVVITGPVDGEVFPAPGSFTIQVEASDPDGTVTNVQFYAGLTRLGVATNSPWALLVTNLTSGTYALTATAMDNSGGTSTSAPVRIKVNQAPTASISSPKTGAILFAPASFTFQAAAADKDGTFAGVEFYQDSTLVGVATNTPYAVGVSNLAAGTYVLTVRVTDNDGAVATSTPVTITVDQPPLVTITAPTNGFALSAPASLEVRAEAVDLDGTVVRVEFYRGTTYWGVATNSPYTFAVSNLAAGTYVLSAKATDNLGGTTTSDIVTVTVGQPPSISISSPTSGTVFHAPANFTIQTVPAARSGTIVKVDFYNSMNDVWLGVATNSPYSLAVSNLTRGTYVLTAKVTDSIGGSAVSSPVTVTVNEPPMVTITSPPDGAVFTAPGNFVLQADAADVDGTVTKVEFYRGTNFLGSAYTQPYAFAVKNLAAGTYVLTAKATDNSGGTSSRSVTVTAGEMPIVSISSPTNGSVFFAPASITLQAEVASTNAAVVTSRILCEHQLRGRGHQQPICGGRE